MIPIVPTGKDTIDNPFSTRFIDPDRHPFVFPPGESLEALGRRLVENRFWGEVIGPHGSGKSTLLQDLCVWAKTNGYHPRFFFLNDLKRLLPFHRLINAVPQFYLVDGAEQLSGPDWWLLRQSCRLRGCGLVISAHRSLGLPLLYRTCPATAETVRRVVEAVAGASEVPTVDEVRSLVQQHQGNLRLILFALYDQWEDRR